MLNIDNRQSYFYILKANIIISKLSLAGNIYIQKSIRYIVPDNTSLFIPYAQWSSKLICLYFSSKVQLVTFGPTGFDILFYHETLVHQKMF